MRHSETGAVTARRHALCDEWPVTVTITAVSPWPTWKQAAQCCTDFVPLTGSGKNLALLEKTAGRAQGKFRSLQVVAHLRRHRHNPHGGLKGFSPTDRAAPDTGPTTADTGTSPRGELPTCFCATGALSIMDAALPRLQPLTVPGSCVHGDEVPGRLIRCFPPSVSLVLQDHWLAVSQGFGIRSPLRVVIHDAGVVIKEAVIFVEGAGVLRQRIEHRPAWTRVLP